MSRYVVTFEPSPDAAGESLAPPAARLRQLLKLALRGMRLRAVDVREVHVGTSAPSNAAACDSGAAERCVACRKPFPAGPPEAAVHVFRGGKYIGQACPSCAAKRKGAA